jgi:hypothetical protein
MHHHAEQVHHHRAVIAENARLAHHAPARLEPAVTPATSTSFSVVPSPSVPQGTPVATAAIADNDIWEVGRPGAPGALAEHFDGTSWAIISSPDPGTASNSLIGVTALSDGTVVAVGTQEDSNTGNPTPLILQN